MSNDLNVYDKTIIGFYIVLWALGIIFQWLVIRKLKAMARSGEESPTIAHEMLGERTIGRSMRFLKFLYSPEVESLADSSLRRNCQILRIFGPLLLFLFIALFVLMQMRG